jgi:hypothetical protein
MFYVLSTILAWFGAFFAVSSAINLPGYSLRTNGRFFETQDGEPFFWQADTAWALFHRFDLSDAEKYLEDRASKGFNMFVLCRRTLDG